MCQHLIAIQRRLTHQTTTVRWQVNKVFASGLSPHPFTSSHPVPMNIRYRCRDRCPKLSATISVTITRVWKHLYQTYEINGRPMPCRIRLKSLWTSEKFVIKKRHYVQSYGTLHHCKTIRFSVTSTLQQRCSTTWFSPTGSLDSTTSLKVLIPEKNHSNFKHFSD